MILWKDANRHQNMIQQTLYRKDRELLSLISFLYDGEVRTIQEKQMKPNPILELQALSMYHTEG